MSQQESRAIAKMTRNAPIYGCLDNFRESLATPTATFPEIVNGLLLQSIAWKCVQNLKFVALPACWILALVSEDLVVCVAQCFREQLQNTFQKQLVSCYGCLWNRTTTSYALEYAYNPLIR